METPTKKLSAEVLCSHSEWIHDLARCLVADPSCADDLAQETWLAALEHPPRRPGPLKPWLGGVMRNLERLRRRGEGRRRRRQEARAREEALPSTDELVAGIETQRLVADAVLELAEPYRTTVFLRYWQRLSSAEIARRQGLAQGTVRSRLKRGLDQLRARLDAASGGERRQWVGALSPFLTTPLQVGAAATVPMAHSIGAKLAQNSVLAALLVGCFGLSLGLLPMVRDLGQTSHAASAGVELVDAIRPEPRRLALLAVPEELLPAQPISIAAHGSTFPLAADEEPAAQVGPAAAEAQEPEEPYTKTTPELDPRFRNTLPTRVSSYRTRVRSQQTDALLRAPGGEWVRPGECTAMTFEAVRLVEVAEQPGPQVRSKGEFLRHYSKVRYEKLTLELESGGTRVDLDSGRRLPVGELEGATVHFVWSGNRQEYDRTALPPLDPPRGPFDHLPENLREPLVADLWSSMEFDPVDPNYELTRRGWSLGPEDLLPIIAPGGDLKGNAETSFVDQDESTLALIPIGDVFARLLKRGKTDLRGQATLKGGRREPGRRLAEIEIELSLVAFGDLIELGIVKQQELESPESGQALLDKCDLRIELEAKGLLLWDTALRVAHSLDLKGEWVSTSTLVIAGTCPLEAKVTIEGELELEARYRTLEASALGDSGTALSAR